MTVVLEIEPTGAGKLSLDQICAVANGNEDVQLSDEAASVIKARRDAIVKAVIDSPNEPLYGFNRGFGSNVRDAVPLNRLADLQRNLILSHAVGMGEPAPVNVVRATMLLRARSLARGHSCVRPVVIQRLLNLLNHKITPVVPRFGSVSASGDLAPLSHIALALLGEGDVFVPAENGDEQRMSAKTALARAGIAPLELEMKEGLALNNGCQYSTAWTALAADAMRRLIDTAAIATALTGQVMLGTDTSFRADLHALRRHPGSMRVAHRIHALFQNSPIREFHRRYEIDGEVQDPYNLRCAAQILGACDDLVGRAIETVEIEANSVTDNPIDVTPIGRTSAQDNIVSGGHFHGMSLAVDAYGLIQAAGIAARLSNMRCVRFVDADRNKGLGPQLKWPGAGSIPAERISPHKTAEQLSTESGMLIPEYVTGGLANWIWGLAMPSHLMSLSTDSGQEDHVSMAANVAMRAHDAAERLSEVLAIELAYGAQAAAIRSKRLELQSRPIEHENTLSIMAPEGTSFVRPMPVDITAALANVASVRSDAPVSDTPATLEAYQPVWWRKMKPGDDALSPPCERVRQAIARHFPIVERDRYMAAELAALAKAVRAGEIQQAADAA
jgi:histidine ammonia-lyase